MKNLFKNMVLIGIILVMVCGCAANSSDTQSPENSGTSQTESGASAAESEQTGNSSSDKEKFVLTPAKKVNDFQNEGKVVLCFGDSITQGYGMNTGYTYPEQLAANLNGQYKVINAGVGGEPGNAILSRANCVKTVTSADIVFKAGQSEVTMPKTLFAVDKSVPHEMLGMGNQLNISRVIIGNTEYNISSVQTGTAWNDISYTVKRQNSEKALTIPKGTSVKFDYTGQYQSIYCAVFLFGANDGSERNDKTIIEKYKLAQKLCDKVIFIAPYFYGLNSDKSFDKVFGKNIINFREYTLTKAFNDYDIDKPDVLEYSKKNNLVPMYFNYDNSRTDCHLSALGYKVIADLVYQKGVELKYWK